MYKLFYIFLCLSILSACQKDNITLSRTASNGTTVQQGNTHTIEGHKVTNDTTNTYQVIDNWREGTVVFLEFEGGFYGIIDDNKNKLLPLNLAPQYKKVGTTIKFKGKKENDIISIQQWGTAFTITDIELIALGADTKNPEY